VLGLNFHVNNEIKVLSACINGHNRRSKLNFRVEFCNTFLYQESVVNMGIKLYNKVPESIKKIG